MKQIRTLVQWTVGGMLPLLLINSASALVISGSVTGGTAVAAGGTFVNLAPPQIVGADVFNQPHLYAMNEKQLVTLSSALTTDTGVIAAGTKVASHLVWFDPLQTTTISGTVKFANKIVGIIWRTGSATSGLNGTNALLGDPGTTYLNQVGWGTEVGTPVPGLGMERAVVIGAGDEIEFVSQSRSPGDYIRVITAVPEPGSIAFLAACAAGALFVRARRRRIQAVA